jgi:hypothetical protein
VVSVLVALVGLALLVVSVRQAGWPAVVSGFRSVGAWFLAVVALGAARMAVRARAWSLCSQVDRAAGIPFGAAFRAALAADAVGNLTPLGLLASEPTKVMMGRRHLSTILSVSSVAVENGFYTASVLVMLLAGAWALLQNPSVPPALERLGEILVGASIVASLVALVVFRTRPAILSRLWARLGRGDRHASINEAVVEVEGRLYDVAHWPLGRLCHVATWETLFHVAAVAEVWLILRALPGGGGTRFIDAFVLEATGRFITVAFKFIPYRLGVDEVGSGSVSQLLGLGPTVGVTLALVRRARILVLNAIGVAVLARHR